MNVGRGMVALTAALSENSTGRFVDFCEKGGIKSDFYLNHPNIGVPQAYHKMWEAYKDDEVQIYIHDDVGIYDEDWVVKVALEFFDHGSDKVAIVGLGGAVGIGVRDIYKTPYQIQQLIRHGYGSNQRDHATHGEQIVQPRQAAVVDGFFMAVSGKFLKEINGWSWIKSNFHCYDLAMCLEAARRGWAVRTVGIDCEHHGGGTSTSPEYVEWCKEHATSPEEEHRAPHRWLYDRYRDVLPLRVEP